MSFGIYFCLIICLLILLYRKQWIKSSLIKINGMLQFDYEIIIYKINGILFGSNTFMKIFFKMSCFKM